MAKKKSDFEQLIGVLEQFSEETIQEVLEKIGWIKPETDDYVEEKETVYVQNEFTQLEEEGQFQIIPIQFSLPLLIAGAGRQIPLLYPAITPPHGSTNISLAWFCKWRLLGKGGRNRSIQNNGPGNMEVVCHGSDTHPPGTGYPVLYEYPPGCGGRVTSSECPQGKYLWVHHGGRAPKGSGPMTGWFTDFFTTTGIKLKQFCRWACVGRGQQDLDIENKGPGNMEVVIGNSSTQHPAGAYHVEKELKKGESHHVKASDARKNQYIWVHHSGPAGPNSGKPIKGKVS